MRMQGIKVIPHVWNLHITRQDGTEIPARGFRVEFNGYPLMDDKGRFRRFDTKHEAREAAIGQVIGALAEASDYDTQQGRSE